MTTKPGLGVGDSMGISPVHIQDYISDMLGELQIMASDSGLKDLANLLSATHNAARMHAKD